MDATPSSAVELIHPSSDIVVPVHSDADRLFWLEGIYDWTLWVAPR